ncbi:MAG: InlB B-repeat-containing protein [Bacilli bacterium]|nr:InlB B-repeat-containing protein [Bacilli bacterium]
MKKKILMAMMLFASLGVAACNNGVNDKSGGPAISSSAEATSFTVTFHLNDGSTNDVYSTITVDKGGKAERPATDPTREGFVFDDWYKDADLETVYDFSKAVNKSINIYAGWLEVLDVTLNLNYQGAPAPTVNKVAEKSKFAEPSDPTREGYAFTGWMLSAEGPHYYDFNQPVKEAMTLYASWGPVGSKKIKATTLEAELCPCITEDRDGLGMQGATYSGGSNGRNLIQQDDKEGSAKASGGYFVHHLYERGNTLVFDILSDVGALNVTIYMRLSAEYKNPVNIDSDKYKVKVNGEAIAYPAISFTGVPEQGNGFRAFDDHLLSTAITLREGENKIEMVTDNLEKMQGTAPATAPMVDALKIYSASTVTWPNAKVANLIEDGE